MDTLAESKEIGFHHVAAGPCYFLSGHLTVMAMVLNKPCQTNAQYL